MLSMLLAMVAGALFGRWIGSWEPNKVAPQKIRTGDPRRSLRVRQ